MTFEVAGLEVGADVKPSLPGLTVAQSSLASRLSLHRPSCSE